MRVIGLHGKKGSGKDTVATLIQEKHPSAALDAFATPIKEGAKAMFDLTEEHVNGSLKETVIPTIGCSPRYILQHLGTEFARNCIHPDVWTNLLKERIERATSQVVVITDLRFDNEADCIRELGGEIWNIVRDVSDTDTHSSEHGIQKEKIDYNIDNNGTLEKLKKNVHLRL